jgi:hypothetical protein
VRGVRAVGEPELLVDDCIKKLGASHYHCLAINVHSLSP